MLELNGSQIKVFRIGLQTAFSGPDALDAFLREDLDKHLNFYAGGEDPFPIAAFKLIEGAQAEGWIGEFVTKAPLTVFCRGFHPPSVQAWRHIHPLSGTRQRSHRAEGE